MEKRSGRNNPILDSLLRGRVYTPIRFSQDFVNNNLFVKPERGDAEQQLFKTQTFDPRATTPKEGTSYFNTGNSFTPAINSQGLGELGLSPLDGLSWDTLYNRDHTTKNYSDIQHKGLKPISYPNVNRDNLNIRNNSSGMISNFGRTSLLGGGLLTLIGLGGIADALQLNEGGEP